MRPNATLADQRCALCALLRKAASTDRDVLVVFQEVFTDPTPVAAQIVHSLMQDFFVCGYITNFAGIDGSGKTVLYHEITNAGRRYAESLGVTSNTSSVTE